MEKALLFESQQGIISKLLICKSCLLEACLPITVISLFYIILKDMYDCKCILLICLHKTKFKKI